MTDRSPDDERDELEAAEENRELDADFEEEVEQDDVLDDEIDEEDEGDGDESDGDEGDEDGENEDDTGTQESDPAFEARLFKSGRVPDDETIGTLRFVANPEFPYTLNIPNPPRFWMEEQTGVLNDAVETYMRGDALKPPQMTAIKTYLKQFLERAPLTGDANVGQLLRKLDKVRSTRDLENFADEAAEYGAEAF